MLLYNKMNGKKILFSSIIMKSNFHIKLKQKATRHIMLTIILAFRKLRQKDGELEIIVDYMVNCRPVGLGAAT